MRWGVRSGRGRPRLAGGVRMARTSLHIHCPSIPRNRTGSSASLGAGAIRPRRAPARLAGHRCARRAGKGTCPQPDACNSIQNAGAPVAAERLVHITHPFHPFRGRPLRCVGERYNKWGKRLLLQVDPDFICSVPPQWTDLAAPDPSIVMCDARALVRFSDLVELDRMVTRLRTGKATGNGTCHVR